VYAKNGEEIKSFKGISTDIDERVLSDLAKCKIGISVKFEHCSLSSFTSQVNSKPLIFHLDADVKLVRIKGSEEKQSVIALENQCGLVESLTILNLESIFKVCKNKPLILVSLTENSEAIARAFI
jgi:hypothetical protein